ncbi:predicted protein [Nematostella vectensis]|uniref:Uncharacterized protein n=1 Tax=Nematostella vectensis TaxID=45351 RepID=A7RQG3_NEMVE|nr:predicted protein [Nematostella vectensis]|eukprot:XP_001638423.1 predicted protein [Nematostella vectensis]
MADELEKFLRRFQNHSKQIWAKLKAKGNKKAKRVRASDIVEASVLSAASFPLCLGVIQNTVFRPLRLTSHIRILAPACGAISVAVSGAISSLVFITYTEKSKDAKDRYFESHKSQFDSYFRTIRYSYSPMDIAVCVVGSLFVFKTLGGRFRSVLPSSLLHAGAFAKVSLPAVSKLYASDTTKRKLVKLGKRYGCHTCGRKRWQTFVGDHIPPNKLLKPGKTQRFYPQCTNCSNKQGAALSTNSKMRRIKTHGLTLKVYHVWLPLPGLLMAARDCFLKV